MIRKIAAALALTLALAAPVQEAQAQDVLGGALIGGVGGAIVGGAIGRNIGGAAIGAVIGAAAGAAIANEGQRRRNNHFIYNGQCWRRRGDGSWMRVAWRYCG